MDLACSMSLDFLDTWKVQYLCMQIIFVKCVQLRGKEVVVECKFDGDRIQVHKNGNKIHFWSRQVPHGSPPFKIQNLLHTWLLCRLLSV